jgi:hypothetical protein
MSVEGTPEPGLARPSDSVMACDAPWQLAALAVATGSRSSSATPTSAHRAREAAVIRTIEGSNVHWFGRDPHGPKVPDELNG